MLKTRFSQSPQFSSARFVSLSSSIKPELLVGIAVVLGLVAQLLAVAAVIRLNSTLAVYAFLGWVAILAFAGNRLLLRWQTTQVRVTASADAPNQPKVYRISGKLCCASVSRFSQHFQFLTDPQQVVLNFRQAQICDAAAIEAIEQVILHYRHLHKDVNLVGLNCQSHAVVCQSGLAARLMNSQSAPMQPAQVESSAPQQATHQFV